MEAHGGSKSRSVMKLYKLGLVGREENRSYISRIKYLLASAVAMDDMLQRTTIYIWNILN
jgi:predicted transcriptional regulator